MAETVCSLDTDCRGKVNAAKVDYYGRRLATGDSTGALKVFDLSNLQQPMTMTEVKEHNGPIFSVQWAHPRFPGVVASAGFDRKVCVYRELTKSQWAVAHTDTNFKASVNSLAFAPFNRGFYLSCGSSDGSVAVIHYNNYSSQFSRAATIDKAHAAGVSSVCWGVDNAEMNVQDLTNAQIASGGMCGGLKIWRENGGNWDCSNDILEGRHNKWVTAMSWRDRTPEGGMGLLASGGEDGLVLFHTKMNDTQWKVVGRLLFNEPVYDVQFSENGQQLLVSYGNNQTCLYKEEQPGVNNTAVSFAIEQEIDENGINPAAGQGGSNQSFNRSNSPHGQQNQGPISPQGSSQYGGSQQQQQITYPPHTPQQNPVGSMPGSGHHGPMSQGYPIGHSPHITPSHQPPSQQMNSFQNHQSPHNNLMGAPPQMGGAPPSQMGGAPPPQMGGAPPQQMGGAPPPQMGGAPPPQQMGGAPPPQMGQPNPFGQQPPQYNQSPFPGQQNNAFQGY